MDLDIIKKPLMVAFVEDNKKNGPTHITDLIRITIKSLMPSEKNLGVNIDYNRYAEEMKLWKYYRHGENLSLINISTDVDPDIYWQDKDDSVLLRIIPIVLVNENYFVIREEIIKNVLFTTGRIETIIEAILIGKLLYLIIAGEENILDNLKQEIINLSQVDFIFNYQKNFKAQLEDYNGKFAVDFERCKIYALKALNLSFSKGFESLQDCIRVYVDNSSGGNIIAKCIEASLREEYRYDTGLASFYNNLGDYVYRLRKGRIDPEVLKIQKYDLPDVFKFNEGDVFFHSLLNSSKVIKKEKIDNRIIMHINTKLGIYIFKR